MEFLALFFTDWNFHLILPNIWILALFLQTLELLSYPSIANIEILALPFQTMNFSPLFIHTGFLISSFRTLGFWPYFYKRWIYDLMIPKNGILTLFFINIGILTLSFQTLEFLYFRSKHWNSGPIFINIGIFILSFHCNHWNSRPILPAIGILAQF